MQMSQHGTQWESKNIRKKNARKNNNNILQEEHFR